ncbi:hypothetical protein HYW39_02830 [Candidatus Curtissbacteria bacterium]|nr:hypothetical protein [Candidatus Curtissbacteria bacterium]
MEETAEYPLATPAKKFVEGLIGKYGDDVFRVIFGTCRNPITRFRVIRELTRDDYRKIMPDHSARGDEYEVFLGKLTKSQ